MTLQVAESITLDMVLFFTCDSLTGSLSVILLVVDMRDVDEYFRENLQYWLEFVNVHSTDASKPHLIIVGSHADQCKRQNGKIKLITATT